MLEPEFHGVTTNTAAPAALPVFNNGVVQVPDVDTLEARVARIESMVSEMYTTIHAAKPTMDAIAAEVAEKGLAGLLGLAMGAMRPGK